MLEVGSILSDSVLFMMFRCFLFDSPGDWCYLAGVLCPGWMELAGSVGHLDDDVEGPATGSSDSLSWTSSSF